MKWYLVLFVKLIQLVRKTQNAVLYWVVFSSTNFPIFSAAMMVFAFLFLFVGGVHLIFRMKYFGVLVGAFVMAGFVWMAYLTGLVETVGSHVRSIPMKQVRFSLRPEELKQLSDDQWLQLKIFRGESLQKFIDTNKKLAKAWGPGSLARASPTRAVPVIIDPLFPGPGERFWALENDAIVRFGLQGYVDVRIRIVDPATVIPDVATVLERWQDLRVRVAQANRDDVAKKMRGLEFVLEYPLLADDGSYRKLEVFFKKIELPASTRGSRKSVSYSIEELEAEVDGWIAESQRQAAEKEERRISKRSERQTSDGSPSESRSPTVKNDPRFRGSLDTEEKNKPTCRKGHPLKIYQKQVSANCDMCSSKTVKGEKVMICIYSPTCMFQSCSRCIPLQDDEEEGLCVCCLDEPASMVMKGCGHLVFCTSCCRSVIARSLNLANKTLVKPNQLTKSPVSCPVCRTVSCMVEKLHTMDTVYKQ